MWLRITTPLMHVSVWTTTIYHNPKRQCILVAEAQDFLLIMQRFLSRDVFLSAEGVVPTEHGPILIMTHDHCCLGFLIQRHRAMRK